MLWGLVGARSAIIHVHMYSTSCHRMQCSTLPAAAAAAAAVAAVITLSAVDGDLHTHTHTEGKGLCNSIFHVHKL